MIDSGICCVCVMHMLIGMGRRKGRVLSPWFLYRVPLLQDICRSMLEVPIALNMGSKSTGPSMQASRDIEDAWREPEATNAANQTSTVSVT